MKVKTGLLNFQIHILYWWILQSLQPVIVKFSYEFKTSKETINSLGNQNRESKYHFFFIITFKYFLLFFIDVNFADFSANIAKLSPAS